MRKFFKLLGGSFAGISTILIVGAANSATGRSVNSVSVQRMPTMSVNSVNVNTVTTLPTSATATNTVTVPVCDDGSVQNSNYTIENCMDDVLACVNGGALPNGLNDLFNSDLRNSIFNGMGLCSAQVDKCISDVRKNCEDIYSVSSDVWVDFNSRKIQPEYFSFVLRKTGLTPNQAENTCLLLDRNTYGTSFTAVANDGSVTSEYDNGVGAYNKQGGGSLDKSNPQGVTVNSDSNTVDGQRGYYARWDATTGECLVRVAAYNKNSQITNNWLFGAVGDNEKAEIWKPAGENFTCDKDLFGFSLRNKTKNVATIGVGGGALLGAGIGAMSGHGKRYFDCSNKSAVKKLGEQIRETGDAGTLNKYLPEDNKISAVGAITENQCEAVLDLYDSYMQGKSIDTKNCKISLDSLEATVVKKSFQDCDGTVAGVDECGEPNYSRVKINGKWYPVSGFVTPDQVNNLENGSSITVSYIPESGASKDCTYVNLGADLQYGTKVICESEGASECISAADFNRQIKELGKIYGNLEILEGEKSNIGVSTVVGTGIGAAAGGLATAITAFVEKNNITCHVGDDLKRVGFGKSYSIESLKDFYVKWALNLPDTVMPTSYVNDCNSWRQACASLTDLNQCAIAQVNYRPSNTSASQLIDTACVVSGSACIENSVVTTSYGACDYE